MSEEHDLATAYNEASIRPAEMLDRALETGDFEEYDAAHAAAETFGDAYREAVRKRKDGETDD